MRPVSDPGRPIVLIRGGEEVIAAAAAELRATGWVTRPGWELPEDAWDVKRIICTGVVRDAAEAGAAVLAAARGAGLVVGLQAPDEVTDRLFEDLRRLGHVELREGSASPSPADALEPEQRVLLGLLASGYTLDEVAEQLSYSRRTVSRRLAAARATLGVETDAEAITRVAARA